jgi:hypothetical protein
VIVVTPTALIAKAEATNISCFGGATTVTVSATGGTTPYTGTGTFTVPAGTYNYIVTDALGLKDTATITVTAPTQLNLTLSAGVVNSATDTTRITAIGSGGKNPLSYQLNTGAFQTSGLFYGVKAGTYSITLKDSNACTITKPIVIVVTPTALIAKAEATNISCFGGATTVTVSATGGTTPYTGTGTFTVPAGTYNYIVSDALGLKDTATITVTEPTKLNLTLSAGVVNSLTDTTRITAIGSGGKNPLSYQLNTGAFQASGLFYGVKAGTYSITLKDSNACTITKPIVIVVTPTALIAKAQAANISCFGGTTTVTVSATGGTTPYTGTGTFTVPAGTYNYIVTDALGLKDTATITVTAPSKLFMNISAGTVPTFYDTTRIIASAYGGTSPYSYKLNDGAYQSSGTFYGNIAGVYTVTAKDANGCTITQTIQIIVTGLPPLPDKKFRIVVYPNPTTTYFTLKTIKYRGSALPIKIRVFNSTSTLVYAMQGMTDVIYTFGGNFPPGTYTIIAEVDNTIQALNIIKM